MGFLIRTYRMFTCKEVRYSSVFTACRAWLIICRNDIISADGLTYPLPLSF